MKNASSGVHGCGFNTMVQPAASAGADFTTLSMKGKLNGVIAATTPIGSRMIALPPTLVGPPVGGPISSHSTECWTCSAFDRNMPIEPPACTKSVMNPVEPVSATMSSRSSAPRDSRISAIRMSAAARSVGFIHGHGPSSKALRGGLDRAHRVLRGRFGHAPDGLLRGRVDHVDLAATLAFGPLTVDIEVVVPWRAHWVSLLSRTVR